jgi:N-acetylglucosaminyl-diphospho-decaprenol L-rhamnosyltransferase
MTPFAVVCVLHDSAGPLRALLASLDAQLPGRRRPQLIVVDTGSTDGGPELAAAAGAELVELEGNPGFGAANNAGLERARHPVTVLLNPDCELLDDGLARLAGLAAAGPPALHVPRLLNPDGTVQDSAHRLPGTAGGLLAALLPAWALPPVVRERAEPWRSERPRTVGWAIAACVAAPTATLRALGPFDPTHFLFHEDLELCLRARAARIPTVLHPALQVRHLGGHATGLAYADEPHALQAATRRAAVERGLGRRARRLDDLALLCTYATRAAARTALGRPADRERAQLAAQRAVVRGGL